MSSVPRIRPRRQGGRQDLARTRGARDRAAAAPVPVPRRRSRPSRHAGRPDREDASTLSATGTSHPTLPVVRPRCSLAPVAQRFRFGEPGRAAPRRDAAGPSSPAAIASGAAGTRANTGADVSCLAPGLPPSFRADHPRDDRRARRPGRVGPPVLELQRSDAPGRPPPACRPSAPPCRTERQPLLVAQRGPDINRGARIPRARPTRRTCSPRPPSPSPSPAASAAGPPSSARTGAGGRHPRDHPHGFVHVDVGGFNLAWARCRTSRPPRRIRSSGWTMRTSTGCGRRGVARAHEHEPGGELGSPRASCSARQHDDLARRPRGRRPAAAAARLSLLGHAGHADARGAQRSGRTKRRRHRRGRGPPARARRRLVRACRRSAPSPTTTQVAVSGPTGRSRRRWLRTACHGPGARVYLRLENITGTTLHASGVHVHINVPPAQGDRLPRPPGRDGLDVRCRRGLRRTATHSGAGVDATFDITRIVRALSAGRTVEPAALQVSFTPVPDARGNVARG